jgi:hypothetical protein
LSVDLLFFGSEPARKPNKSWYFIALGLTATFLDLVLFSSFLPKFPKLRGFGVLEFRTISDFGRNPKPTPKPLGGAEEKELRA